MSFWTKWKISKTSTQVFSRFFVLFYQIVYSANCCTTFRKTWRRKINSSACVGTCNRFYQKNQRYLIRWLSMYPADFLIWFLWFRKVSILMWLIFGNVYIQCKKSEFAFVNQWVTCFCFFLKDVFSNLFFKDNANSTNKCNGIIGLR